FGILSKPLLDKFNSPFIKLYLGFLTSVLSIEFLGLYLGLLGILYLGFFSSNLYIFLFSSNNKALSYFSANSKNFSSLIFPFLPNNSSLTSSLHVEYKLYASDK